MTIDNKRGRDQKRKRVQRNATAHAHESAAKRTLRKLATRPITEG